MKASPILDLISRAVEDRRLRELPDHQVIERFHAQQEEAAFHTLLRRHGPLVLDVCRGVLGNEADAEDAFQATFLALARKACSIRKKTSLSSWLHGVAYRTALKARAQFAARQKHEARVPARLPFEPDDLSWCEVRQILHEELNGLPERYRAPLVLCYLQGATQEAAAIQLHLAKSTLRERLERGRTLLRARLIRRGVGTAGLLVAAAWPTASASACVSPLLVASTLKAASLFARGPAAAGAISAKVVALTEGVLKTMQLTKLKIAAIAVLVVGALSIGASALPYPTAAAEPQRPVSKSAVPVQDQGNLKETVLALEKRIWEAHTRQDVGTFKNLLADDFVGTDMLGHPYNKAATLDYVGKFRVLEYELRGVKVIPLNSTGAILSYEVHYKVRPTGGGEIESTTRRATAAWAQRKGRWYYVYFEDKLLAKDEAALNVFRFDGEEGFREILLKRSREKDSPKE